MPEIQITNKYQAMKARITLLFLRHCVIRHNCQLTCNRNNYPVQK